MGKADAVTIDFMRKEDIDQVLAIEQASFTMPWSKNLFLSEFRSPRVSSLMVSLAEGTVRKVSGFIVFWTVEDEMHILNLAVATQFRRQGIARKLVLSALSHARSKGAKRAFLEVRASNTAAQKLYSSLGFSGVTIRRAYYDTPVEDAVIMAIERGAFESLIKSLQNS